MNAHAVPFGLALLGSLAWLGCGSSQTVQEETLPPAQPAAQEVKKPDMEFEMRTDTVDVVRKNTENAAAQADSSVWIIRYTVQIGAFKDPHNASLAQAQAKTQFPMTVTNEFDQKTGLYQIRVGSFERKEEATAFRQRVQREFPAEYAGSWVAEVKKPK